MVSRVLSSPPLLQEGSSRFKTDGQLVRVHEDGREEAGGHAQGLGAGVFRTRPTGARLSRGHCWRPRRRIPHSRRPASISIVRNNFIADAAPLLLAAELATPSPIK